VHSSDFASLALLRTSGRAAMLVGESTVTQNGESAAPPTDATALMSWGMPAVLSVAAEPGTVWVVARDARRLFVDGAVLVDWSEAEGFKSNERQCRAETCVLPVVLKPIYRVNTPPPGGDARARAASTSRCCVMWLRASDGRRQGNFRHENRATG
jgi:hypothetical protein